MYYICMLEYYATTKNKMQFAATCMKLEDMLSKVNEEEQTLEI